MLNQVSRFLSFYTPLKHNDQENLGDGCVMGNQLFSSFSCAIWTLLIYAFFLTAIYASLRWYYLTRHSQQKGTDAE